MKSEPQKVSNNSNRLELTAIKPGMSVEEIQTKLLESMRKSAQTEGPKFSLSREQLTERDSFSRYNEQFSVPIDAYEASSLSRVTSPSPHSENGSHRILFGNKALTVFVPKGFDKFSRNRDKTFGFGQRHMVKARCRGLQANRGVPITA